MDIIIKRASEKDSQNVGRLFDLYRQFYSYESNINLSIDYINERIQKSESVIFFARNDENQTMGFVQLYETFGSLDLGKIIVLYDLYVVDLPIKENEDVTKHLLFYKTDKKNSFSEGRKPSDILFEMFMEIQKLPKIQV